MSKCAKFRGNLDWCEQPGYDPQTRDVFFIFINVFYRITIWRGQNANLSNRVGIGNISPDPGIIFICMDIGRIFVTIYPGVLHQSFRSSHDQLDHKRLFAVKNCVVLTYG